MNTEIKPGQLWRRRSDGFEMRAFIPVAFNRWEFHPTEATYARTGARPFYAGEQFLRAFDLVED